METGYWLEPLSLCLGLIVGNDLKMLCLYLLGQYCLHLTF